MRERERKHLFACGQERERERERERESLSVREGGREKGGDGQRLAGQIRLITQILIIITCTIPKSLANGARPHASVNAQSTSN